jgi:hypothetical protein
MCSPKKAAQVHAAKLFENSFSFLLLSVLAFNIETCEKVTTATCLTLHIHTANGCLQQRFTLVQIETK